MHIARSSAPLSRAATTNKEPRTRGRKSHGLVSKPSGSPPSFTRTAVRLPPYITAAVCCISSHVSWVAGDSRAGSLSLPVRECHCPRANTRTPTPKLYEYFVNVMSNDVNLRVSSSRVTQTNGSLPLSHTHTYLNFGASSGLRSPCGQPSSVSFLKAAPNSFLSSSSSSAYLS